MPSTFVHHNDFASAWFDLLACLHDHGKPVSPRGYETHELLGVHVLVDDMTQNILVHPARNLSYRFLVAEWLWIASGRNDVESITKYNKHIAQFSDDGVTFAGAYGPRIAAQVPWVLEQLTKPGSRQCVVQIWTPSPAASKDIPCTLSWQLLARDRVLHAIVTMRSSDVHLGLPYDFFNFSMLTMGLAGALGLAPGSLIFNLGSSHLYNRDRDKAAAVLLQPELLWCVASPRLPTQPPANEILNYDTSLAAPWLEYRNVLLASTNADSLRILENLNVTQS
jgi:thymidylate synthase